MHRRLPALLVALMLMPALAWASGDRDLSLAYLDPGTGSFIVQALVAALAGVAVTGRLYWTKIKSRLGMGGVSEDDEGPDSDDS